MMVHNTANGEYGMVLPRSDDLDRPQLFLRDHFAQVVTGIHGQGKGRRVCAWSLAFMVILDQESHLLRRQNLKPGARVVNLVSGRTGQLLADPRHNDQLYEVIDSCVMVHTQDATTRRTRRANWRLYNLIAA
ncbi:MAG: hypothetical protein A3A24_03275 [Candidatus Buchananbacteria bacterium RIFCSPLOWO2_01_FULL_46_12]|nr:MAG: hypothetical protein A3A24_03275 [Candidatus Buchananbacteria bacterium RIFCSPLOWO2_01_FULL_46_12]